MPPKQLRRSKNKQLAGVCGGLAEHLELDPNVVRALAIVLAMFTSAPVTLFAYVVAAVILPPADSDGELEVDWQTDGVRVTWPGALAPHAVSWEMWLGFGAAAGGVLVLLGALLALLGAVVGGWWSVDGGFAVTMAFLSAVLPGGAVLYSLAALTRRPYAITVTHDALWVDRPLRRAERIDLTHVESFHPGPGVLTIHLWNGEQVKLPSPAPNAAELEAVWQQVHESRRRALEHRRDLEEARPRQREVEQILVRRGE